ncbi:hypothetical protein AC629_33855 [Bradyrhizobium sp. NAS80.1]|nr:hypothetical protein AC629_33855 [Bradyrhizobium sp. NAS80.1]
MTRTPFQGLTALSALGFLAIIFVGFVKGGSVASDDRPEKFPMRPGWQSFKLTRADASPFDPASNGADRHWTKSASGHLLSSNPVAAMSAADCVEKLKI